MIVGENSDMCYLSKDKTYPNMTVPKLSYAVWLFNGEILNYSQLQKQFVIDCNCRFQISSEYVGVHIPNKMTTPKKH